MLFGLFRGCWEVGLVVLVGWFDYVCLGLGRFGVASCCEGMDAFRGCCGWKKMRGMDILPSAG